MFPERYELKADPNYTLYEFYSEGSKRKNLKVITFTSTDYDIVFNVGFGDKIPEKEYAPLLIESSFLTQSFCHSSIKEFIYKTPQGHQKLQTPVKMLLFTKPLYSDGEYWNNATTNKMFATISRYVNQILE